MADEPEETFRAFLAIPLAESFEASVRPLLDRLREQYPDVKWVWPEQIHVTLHFFGQIDATQVKTITDCVVPITTKSKPLKFTLRGTGAFPNPARPRVIWVGMEGDLEALKQLQDGIEYRLKHAGFHREERSFKPHLTIGRVREGKRMGPWTGVEFAANEPRVISEVTLFKSTLTPEGPRYEKVQTFPLSAS